MPMNVKLAPICGTRGSAMHLEVTTDDGALLATLATYSDGRSYDDFSWGDAKGGVFRWDWVLKPDIPPGPASVLISASAEGDNRGATAEAGFEVREPGRC
jgi:hypothetical protein